MTRSGRSSVVVARAASGSAIASASRLTAPRPSSAIRTRIVVSAGRTNAACGMSSKPATAMSSGTTSPSSSNAARQPSAIPSFAANTAPGRRISAPIARPAAYPAASVKSPRTTCGRTLGSDAASSSR